MKRVILSAAICVAIVTIVAGSLWLRRTGEPPATPAAAAATPAPAVTAALPPPAKFDVVRVNPQGLAVLAGRAAPNAEVTAFDGDTAIGRAKADARGEWVIVPVAVLPPGTHTLQLSAPIPGAGQAASDDQVTVIVAAATQAEAKRANRDRIGDPDLIYPGQVFTLPAKN